MAAPRGVVLTARAAITGERAGAPLAVIGGLPAATSAIAGGVLEGAAVSNATVATDGTSAGTQLNLLLASLRASGVIA